MQYLREFLTSPEMMTALAVWLALSIFGTMVVYAMIVVGTRMADTMERPRYRLRLIGGEWFLQTYAPYLKRGWINCEGPFPDHDEAVRAMDCYKERDAQ